MSSDPVQEKIANGDPRPFDGSMRLSFSSGEDPHIRDDRYHYCGNESMGEQQPCQCRRSVANTRRFGLSNLLVGDPFCWTLESVFTVQIFKSVRYLVLIISLSISTALGWTHFDVENWQSDDVNFFQFYVLEKQMTKLVDTQSYSG